MLDWGPKRIALAISHLIFAIAAASARATPHCPTLHAQIGGGEFEFSSVISSMNQANGSAFFGSPVSFANALNHSRYFRRLFGLFGTDRDGVPHQNLIPTRLAQNRALIDALRTAGVEFREEDGRLFVSNYDRLSWYTMTDLFTRLFNAVGPFGRTLSVRKIPAAWNERGFHSSYDQLIPEVASVEWRDGKFIDLEFPMAAPVPHAQDIVSYYRNLWNRLGVFNSPGELERALTHATGHVHWVPKIQELVESARKDAYLATVGYWADRNDHFWVEFFTNASQRTLTAPDQFHVEGDGLMNFHYSFRHHSANFTIAPLLRENYLRLEAGPHGIKVADKLADLEARTVDPNFPPGFKYLAYGLRGKYGQKTIRASLPVPIIGIEARHGTLTANIAELPGAAATEMPLSHLLRHASDKPRGFFGTRSNLVARATALGMEPSLIDEVASVLKTGDMKWAEEPQLAVLFLPLQDLVAHPLAQRNLGALSIERRAEVIGKYEQALAHYRDRMNRLWAARNDRTLEVKVSHLDLAEKTRQPNFVYRLSPSEPAEKDELYSNNALFRALVLSEVRRFAREAELETLMAWPE